MPTFDVSESLSISTFVVSKALYMHQAIKYQVHYHGRDNFEYDTKSISMP